MQLCAGRFLLTLKSEIAVLLPRGRNRAHTLEHTRCPPRRPPPPSPFVDSLRCVAVVSDVTPSPPTPHPHAHLLSLNVCPPHPTVHGRATACLYLKFRGNLRLPLLRGSESDGAGGGGRRGARPTCSSCARRKRVCDGDHPCGSCVEAGLGEHCVFSTKRKSSGSKVGDRLVSQPAVTSRHSSSFDAARERMASKRAGQGRAGRAARSISFSRATSKPEQHHQVFSCCMCDFVIGRCTLLLG